MAAYGLWVGCGASSARQMACAMTSPPNHMGDDSSLRSDDAAAHPAPAASETPYKRFMHRIENPLPPTPEMVALVKEFGPILDRIEARASSKWVPIEDAPLAVWGWLWHPSWRRAFPGMRNADAPQAWVDTCETRAAGYQTVASHWRPADLPPEMGAKGNPGATNNPADLIERARDAAQSGRENIGEWDHNPNLFDELADRITALEEALRATRLWIVSTLLTENDLGDDYDAGKHPIVAKLDRALGAEGEGK